MEFDVRQIFNAWIKARFGARPDVFSYLSNHERRDKCIAALCQQIRIAELSSIKQRFDAQRYRYVIDEVAKMFCSMALRQAEEAAISRAERNRRIVEADRYTQLEEELGEMRQEALSTKLVSRPGDIAR